MTTCWTKQTTVSKQFWMLLLFPSSPTSPRSCILAAMSLPPSEFILSEPGIFQNCDIIRKISRNISEENIYTSLPKVNLWFYIFSRSSKLVSSGIWMEEGGKVVSHWYCFQDKSIKGRSALFVALIFEQWPWFSFSRTMVELNQCVASTRRKLRTFLPR